MVQAGARSRSRKIFGDRSRSRSGAGPNPGAADHWFRATVATFACSCPTFIDGIRLRRKAMGSSSDVARGLNLLFFSFCLELTHGFYKLSEEENVELRRICGMPMANAKAPPVSKDDPHYKVYGGELVGEGEMPWALKVVTISGQVCSGSLISRNHFLTAAHCVERTPVGDHWRFANLDPYKTYGVFGGSPCIGNLASAMLDALHVHISAKRCPDNSKTSRLLRVKAVIVPNSSHYFVTHNLIKTKVTFGEFFYSDIAIFELAEPFGVDDVDLRPICLIDRLQGQESDDNDTVLRSFGYGMIGRRAPHDMATEPELRTFEISHRGLVNCPREDLVGCRDGRLDYAVIYRSSGLNKSLCAGDSGGGLVATSRGISTLIGVFSCGIDYCTTNETLNNYMEVFSRLDLHIDFICRETGVCPISYNFSANALDDAVFVGVNTVTSSAAARWIARGAEGRQLRTVLEKVRRWLREALWGGDARTVISCSSWHAALLLAKLLF